MLLSTPVGTLFPLALLSILGGTLLIGIITSRRKEQADRLRREDEHKEMIRRNSFKRKKKKKMSPSEVEAD